MSSPAKDTAAKDRIIKHMNADHHDSVVRYLEYYHGLPSYKAYSGIISDISLQELVFSCGHKTYKTPFEPPMTAYREARERVVRMDKECLVALDRSDITVDEYIAPHGLYLALFLTVAVTFVAFSSRSNFVPGAIVAAIIPKRFAHFCWVIQPFVLYPMLVIHTWESYHMATRRLRKHSVNIRSRSWWRWIGTTFFEGFGAFDRFDKMIVKKREAKEKQKH